MKNILILMAFFILFIANDCFSQINSSSDSIQITYISKDDVIKQADTNHSSSIDFYTDLINKIKKSDSCVVYVRYEIDVKGKITKIAIIQGNQKTSLNTLAIDYIKQYPNPAWNNKQGIKMQFFLPIKFTDDCK